MYTIDGVNYQSSNIFPGLGSGNYNVTVRDADGLPVSLGAVVYDRCPAVTVLATDETCLRNDGTITATATQRYCSYQYSIDGINFQTIMFLLGYLPGLTPSH